MQTGSVTRHGRGWRGYWREDGRRRATATYAKKGEAREALNREFDRIRLGAAYRSPITFDEAWPRLARLLAGGRPAPGDRDLRHEGRGA